jgi:hypothetical protein
MDAKTLAVLVARATVADMTTEQWQATLHRVIQLIVGDDLRRETPERDILQLWRRDLLESAETRRATDDAVAKIKGRLTGLMLLDAGLDARLRASIRAD